MTIDLLEASEHYVALDASDDAIWLPYSSRTRDKIRSLNILGSKQVHPVMLAAIKRFTLKEFERLAWLLEIVVIRWQIIGGGRTGAIEISCARLAEKIWIKEVKTASDALKVLNDLYTSDGEFRNAFINKGGVTNQKSAYILKMIEIEERRRRLGGRAQELDPAKYLTVEHILPKNPGKEWRKEIEADSELTGDCTLLLGNTCLLTEGRNRAAARKGFDEKKRVYELSDIISTQRLSEFDGWNRPNIKQHQTWLASRAVDIWKFN